MADRFTIRRAGADDVETLSAIGRETFTDAFGHLYSEADLTAFLDQAHSPALYSRFFAEGRDAVWLVETADGQAAAYAVAGPVGLPVDGLANTGGEVKRIYVRKAWQGAGLGRVMMDAAVDWLDGSGFDPLYLGVYSDNAGAQRFYARYGFEKIGEYEFPVGSHRDREFIFCRRTPAQLAAE